MKPELTEEELALLNTLCAELANYVASETFELLHKILDYNINDLTGRSSERLAVVIKQRAFRLRTESAILLGATALKSAVHSIVMQYPLSELDAAGKAELDSEVTDLRRTLSELVEEILPAGDSFEACKKVQKDVTTGLANGDVLVMNGAV